LIADSGFRPETNGLGFENYGASANQNLTPDEVRRIYGDSVCASTTDGKCTLTPPAQQWMEEQNKGMSGGHCYGFSVTALRLWKGDLKADQFGGAPAASALPINGNDLLQRTIALNFVFQGFNSVRNGAIAGTPNDVLDKLIAALKASDNETYTIGFFNAQGSGGHAVTPYAVEDVGNGIMNVLIYDNNYPNITRAINFDRNANVWTYEAATNPSEPSSKYVGDANTKSLFLFPTKPGLAVQPCPFCAAAAGGSAGGVTGSSGGQSAPAGAGYNEIALEGSPDNHGHLVFTDQQGHRTGYVDGKLLTEIPDITIVRDFATQQVWDEAVEPVYRMPPSLVVTVTVDGTALTKADETNVDLIGPGYDLAVDGIMLDPGQKDTLTLAPDGKTLSYTTNKSESPELDLGVDAVGDSPDYAFAVKGVKVEGGGTVSAALDLTGGRFQLSTANATAGGTYGIAMGRFDTTSEQVFGHDSIALAPGDTATLVFGDWKKDGDAMPLVVNHNGTEDTTQLTDDGN
jgi:hypothetical protein